MKDMSDSELHEAIDSAMKTVFERFKRKREAAEAHAASRIPDRLGGFPAAGGDPDDAPKAM